ncbi:carotenoid oxygenase family protein [Myxococcota bacterium]|nr:carotenoid oxygenase family protein [Myxococcota bacterium]
MNAPSPNPFLSGNFAPVHDELDLTELEVVGALPPALRGDFVRVGPNPQHPPRGRYHWFDGDGMVHSVRFDGRGARYKNRWVRTEGFLKEQERGEAIWSGLTEPPDFSNPDGPFKNVANTAFVQFQGELWALWEGGAAHALRADDLGTLGVRDFGGALTHPLTAHPKLDPETGELIFFGYAPLPPYCWYSVADASGALVFTREINLDVGVMMHDFAVTATRSIFMDLPVTMRLDRMMEGGPMMAWEPERGARFGVLPRHGDESQLQWFSRPACMIFHTANAYDDGDEVVLDACRLERTDVLGGAEKTDGEGDDRGRLTRFRFNLKTGVSSEETLHPTPCDFPRVHPGRVGRPHRYTYAARLTSTDDGTPRMDGVIKFDHAAGRGVEQSWGPRRVGGEVVFAPRPGGEAEDDGWLLTFVFDEGAGRSELVVLQAQDLSLVARVLLPVRVPYGFHGDWVPEPGAGQG